MRLRTGFVAVAVTAGMCQLAGCQVGEDGLPPGVSKVPPASGRVLAHAAAKSPPRALAQAGVTAGRQLLVRGLAYWPLFPAAAGAGGLVLGLPTRGVPFNSGRDKLAGYAIVRLSDGRATCLPQVHPAWSPGAVGGILSTAGGRVIWLEADRPPGRYQWALYAARGAHRGPGCSARAAPWPRVPGCRYRSASRDVPCAGRGLGR